MMATRLPDPEAAASAASLATPSPIDRALRLFGDVRAGEGRDVLRHFASLLLLLIAYYILKTVREPLILVGGGAELKSYAAAAQAALLLLYVPAYATLASRVPVTRMVWIVVVFFIACIQLFFLARWAGLPYVGFAFYVWVGIFSLTLIAQFWSFANDIYSKPEGDRLFPLIAVGSTAGAPLGALIAEELFAFGIKPRVMMEIAAALLVVHAWLYRAGRLPVGDAPAAAATGRAAGGFGTVLGSPFLRLIALLLVVLNLVNTLGEYILASLVTAHASAQAALSAGFDQAAYIGQFYGRYFLFVNVASVVIQMFIVSRVVKRFGIAGVLFALPIVACGAYGVALAGAGLSLILAIKVAENATDYSLMNTAKQMLWLPTTREQKYTAKQAIDTFFVRSGDLVAAGLVFLGTHVGLSTAGFAATNVAFVVVAILIARRLLQEYQRLTTTSSETSVEPKNQVLAVGAVR